MPRRIRQKRALFGREMPFELPIVWMTCSKGGLIAIDVKGAADFYDANGFKIGNKEYSSQGRAVSDLEKEGWQRIQQRQEAKQGTDRPGTGFCICPECGYEHKKRRDELCSQYVCPECSGLHSKTVKMVDKEMLRKESNARTVIDKSMKGDNKAGLVKDAAIYTDAREMLSWYDVVDILCVLSEEPIWKIICRHRKIKFGQSVSRKYNIYEDNKEELREQVTRDVTEVVTHMRIIFEKIKVKVTQFKEMCSASGGKNIAEDMQIIESFVANFSKILEKCSVVIEESQKYTVGDLIFLYGKIIRVFGDYKKGADIVGTLIGSDDFVVSSIDS